MARIKHATYTHRRKKRVLKQTKGQFSHRRRRFKQAIRSLIKGMQYAYRDRKTKKRVFRNLWIVRVNAACREAGMTYSRFVQGLKLANIAIDRRILAELAVSSPEAFKKLVAAAQKAEGSAPAKKHTKTAKA